MSHPIVGFCLSNAPTKKQSSSVPVCNEACALSQYAEKYVKHENKLYRESHVSCAFDKLPGNLRVFSGSLHFFFRVGYEQVLYVLWLFATMEAKKAGPCEWKLP